ncbi:NADH oxidase 3 [Pleurostoma richardsiae]|uniref:NADH oxidase 3 n=1 Tax=Pleurostoma richardsiae TaxID=41990 RepID=A0AA38VL44_9PEZI|nr:NADH oxidase 3 [Pleurostoma richardsiae]
MGLDLELAKPFTLPNGLALPNRLVKAAMAEHCADKNGIPNEKLSRAYATWADGGWGMVLTGNVQVDPRYLGAPGDVATAEKQVGEEALLASWRAWAAAGSANGTPLVMQINHPGRQSPAGAGARGFLEKSIAPSPIPLHLPPGGFLAWAMAALAFGTPREMTQADIDHAVARFATTARLAAAAGFAGVEIHAAHGYLLAQFLSAKSNRRADAYGGSAANRARIVVEVIRAIRAAVPAGFAVGIKLNSVDHQSKEELAGCIEQLRLITEAGVDFLEISGGSYENPTMFLGTDKAAGEVEKKSERTKAREAFFLEFARSIRDKFPHVPLVVTGGFRTRAGMEAAVRAGDCEMAGLGRPAVLNPALPHNVVFNAEVSDDDAKLFAKTVEVPWFVKKFGFHAVGAGMESSWYSKKIGEMGSK